MTTLVNSPPLDILVRTSGVKRLSDYLLWQVRRRSIVFHQLHNSPVRYLWYTQCSEDTQLQFTSTYWPEFGLWDFVPIILDFQRKVWAKPVEP